MSETNLVRVYYRATKEDGTIWCESSSATEVVLMSRGQAVKFERMTVVEVTSDWEPWASKIED